MRCRKCSLHVKTGLAIVVASIALTVSLWASQEETLYGFGSAPDGNYPAASLIIDHTGNLYGTTLQGGTLAAVWYSN